jgi:predicted cupin superfamily sugar epimerase
MTNEPPSNAEAALTAADVIRLLDLKPHPEGGHFREIFRDVALVFPPAPAEEGAAARAASTAIYFLLGRGERSHWHRVDTVEIWHWYAGAPLKLEIAREDGRRETVTLGNALAAGERPQAVCPRTPGRRRNRSATGRSSAARSRPPSTSRSSSWRRRAGSRLRHEI